jgi:tRNA(Ile)-lysidine synthase
VNFSPGKLRGALDSILGPDGGATRGLCLALSGGLDSTVLLAALAAEPGAGRPLRAIHVDHGLHADSARWSAHCARLAGRHGIPCEVARVDARAAPGASPEAAARSARYQALSARLAPGEVLLTAHHADDQIEGVLLQWARGGGLRALAGMPALARFGAGWHARPLLGWARAELHAWATGAGLEWLEDPSNLDPRFDRNYLRMEVLPVLRRRWPAIATTVGRVATQAAEALDLDAVAAAADLAELRQGATLSLARLRRLDAPRQRRVLREWLRSAGLPLPGAATLEALRHDVLRAAADRNPESRWPGVVVRRYRERLYAEPADAGGAAWLPGEWRAGEVFDLGALGHLELRPTSGPGLSLRRLAAPLEVLPRPTGGSFRPAGAPQHRPLRKWLQERGVLPWRRVGLPVICAGGEIVAVGDLGCGGGLEAAPGEPAWRVAWHDRPVLTEAEAYGPAASD